MTEPVLVSKDKGKLDLDVIHGFLSDSYWAKGRTREQVRITIENSICFGVYLNGTQIGFARVLTDKAIMAYIMDVFIVEKYRGRGYSKILIREILNDHELLRIKKWLLGTQDAHGLYAQFGFVELAHPERFMTRVVSMRR